MHDGAYDTPMHHGSNNLTVIDRAEPISAMVPEIAKLIGIGERMCWELVSRKEIPSFKIGTARLVRLADARAYIDRLVEEETTRVAAGSAA